MRYSRRLSGADVVTLLIGAAITVALARALPQKPRALFVFAPGLLLLARRRFLPQLSPHLDEAASPPPTLPRRVLGYLLMVVGGFIMCLDGVVLMAPVKLSATAFGVVLAIFIGGAWIASLGFKRVG